LGHSLVLNLIIIRHELGYRRPIRCAIPFTFDASRTIETQG